MLKDRLSALLWQLSGGTFEKAVLNLDIIVQGQICTVISKTNDVKVDY